MGINRPRGRQWGGKERFLAMEMLGESGWLGVICVLLGGCRAGFWCGDVHL